MKLQPTAIAALLAASWIGSAPAGPNVIFILCDDLGYGDIYTLFQHTRDNGAGGGTAGDGIINGSEEAFIFTPGIDRMAAEGARLTRHYTSAPVCAPARGSLLQGLDQGHANIRNNSFDKVIADNHTLGTVMQQAGYYTACVGKWGVGGSSPPYGGHPNNRGFDYFYGYLEHLDGHQHYPGNSGNVYEQGAPVTNGLDHAYTTDLWTARVKDIIQDRHTNQPGTPFFIYLAYDAPHARLQVPTQAYPAGAGTGGGLAWPLNTNSGTDDSWIHPDYAALGTSAGRHATMVRRIDDGVADLLQTLRDLGIDDETLVVFSSDNGTHNESGSGGSIAHNPRNFDCYGEFEGIKRDHWEGGIRMPTFAWWPTHIGDNNPATPGQDSTRPSAFWDWLPTLVEAAGRTPPAWSSGVSLLPELTGAGAQLDKGYLYFEYNVGGSTPNYTDFPNHGGATRGEMQTLFLDDTDGKRYKGVRTGIANHSQDFLIYDVGADSDEGTNLAASKPALQQRMKDKVLRVRIDGDYNRGYLSGEHAPGVSVSVVNGLECNVYTGTWAWVPEVDYLTPVAGGDSTGLDLSKRTRDDHIAMEFTGYISVPTDGTYTFSLTTDASVGTNTSGGMLWIHDAHLVDDDFHHTGAPRSGSMRLQAGLHPIRVLYKHATGSHDIQLQYSGPGISQQTVPDAALFREGVVPPGPPTARDDVATTLGSTTGPGASRLVNVLSNDSDDGTPDPLTITDPGAPLAGSAVVDSDRIRYTPNQGFFGTDRFLYTISDGQDTASATVAVDVLVDSVDLWFPLDESTGNTVAEAGGLVAGAHAGFANSEAAHVVGKHGYALTFDGVDDQVDLTGLTLPTGDSPRTVCAWVRTSDTSGAEFQVVFGYGQNSNGQRFSFRLDTSPATNQRLRLEVQGGFIVGSTRINDGAWHHVAAVVDDFNGDGTTNVNETRLYVDGVLEGVGGSGSEAIQTSPSGVPAIGGSNHAAGYNFNGEIDEVRIYPSALSGPEVAALAAASAAETDANLWFFRNLGNPAPTPADWDTDTDGDGYSHFAAYALGGSPHWFDPAMEPWFEPTPGGFDYLYHRRQARDPNTYIVQTSSLGLLNPDWSPVGGGAAAPHPELAAYDVVTVPIPFDSEPERYYRLHVLY